MFSVSPNGTVRGMLSNLLPESERRASGNTSESSGFEVSMIPIAMTKQRADVVDFSTPLIMDEHIVLLPYPTFENDVLGLIRPFHPLVSETSYFKSLSERRSGQ